MGVRMWTVDHKCGCHISYYNNGEVTNYPHDYNCDTMKQERIIQCRMEQMFGK